MPRPVRPDVLKGCVFRKRDVIVDGVLTEDALRSSAWRRLFRGVYADAEMPDSYDLRIRGARLLMPPGAVFSGRTAAHLHGATELTDIDGPVEVTVPRGLRFGPVTGFSIRQAHLPERDVATVRGWSSTTGLRTALDIARREPLAEAVAALDIMLARGIVGLRELRDSAGLDAGRGASRVRRAAELADPRAESQPESHLRVLLALAGLAAVPQHLVRDATGTVVARVDLAFPEHRVAIEYDGMWHAERGQFLKDRRRLNRLVAAGWTVVHVTAADLRDPAPLLARIRALVTAIPRSGN